MVGHLSDRASHLLVGAFFIAVVIAQLFLGRTPWGSPGVPGLVTADAHGPYTSQFLFDPYTLTHVTHGVVFYGAVRMIARRLTTPQAAVVVMAIEGVWEIFENSDLIINRYRETTISQDYYGDSIVNSFGDMLACLGGLWLTSRLSRRLSIAFFLALELVLLVLIKDSLLLNVIMLIYPVTAIKLWQGG